MFNGLNVKNFKTLVAELPRKSIVTAFCRCDPITSKHYLLMKFLEKTAETHHADSVIFVTEDGVIPINRRLHYLKLAYPNIHYKVTSAITFTQAITELKQYKNIIAISDTLESTKYIKVINVKPYIDFDDHSEKLLSLAQNGDWDQFQDNAPSTLRTIDIRRMFNDIRVANGQEVILEDCASGGNALREQYLSGTIFNLGETVTIAGVPMTITRRGTNYVSLIDELGKIQTKFLTDLAGNE